MNLALVCHWNLMRRGQILLSSPLPQGEIQGTGSKFTYLLMLLCLMVLRNKKSYKDEKVEIGFSKEGFMYEH